MGAGEWIALAAVLLTLISGITAAVWVVSSKLGGLQTAIERIGESVKKLFDLWDEKPWEQLPCASRGERIAQAEVRLDNHEQRIESLEDRNR